MSAHDRIDAEYTVAMQKFVEASNSELKSFYCREDLSDLLLRLGLATKDNFIFRKKDLERLCAARDLIAEALYADPNLLENVPTRAALQDQLLEILHDNYDRFYSSTDYMTRIVRRMAPEYRSDTVRTAILKKFISGVGFTWRDGKKVGRQYRTREILEWARERFSPEEAAEYEHFSDDEKLALIAGKLNDSIFSANHMNRSLDHAELFLLIVKRLADWVQTLEITEYDEIAKTGESERSFSDLPLREETAAAVRTFCSTQHLSYDPGSGNLACLSAIADMLEKEHQETEQAVILIQPFFQFLQEDFDQFLHITYYKNKKGKYQKLAMLFKTNRRDARDKKAADWELLRLCDDYANGKFRTNGGKTRVYLYYFAMMFGMTFRQDKRFDLEKNLFEDYYSDNVLRFLSKEYSDQKAVAQYESEPMGDGINYKNYAEIIYLYYLFRREISENPGERIDRAEQMISDCRKAAADKKHPYAYIRRAAEGFTDYFRDEYFPRFLNLKENELKAFILEHYLVLSEKNEGRAATMVSAEENTAYDNVELIMENLHDIYSGSITASQLMAPGKFADAEEKRQLAWR